LPSTLVSRSAIAVVALFLLLPACRDSGDDTSVSFAEPTDSTTVAGSVALAMAADGITIEEAGDVREGAGHFHVIADDGCVEPGAAVPKDADHVHFGKGQSDGKIYLEPGTHELCLQVADGAHVALDATDTVSVEVGIAEREDWCAVVGEVDVLFSDTDTNGEEFAARQIGYENVRRLIAQLTDALDQVDADARDDVAEALDVGSTIASAFAEAEDEDAAIAAVEEIFSVEGVQSDGAGATWILDTCGIDIDG
jgi:hypothetical protein